MNLHQLRIFCAIAQSSTLTQAAKQLGLAQPTLSQQLSRLEEKVGTKLFDRVLNQMELTVAGQFLLRRAQMILSEVEDVQGQLREFASGTRGIIRMAGLNSIIRAVLPKAIVLLKERLPEVEFDIHEMGPAEVLDLLYCRQINIGLVAADGLSLSTPYKTVSIVTDPYVFAVPAGLDLSAVSNPDADLSSGDRNVLNSAIRFNFASELSRRFERWYHDTLPHHHLVAQCRSYEVALSLVRAGLGVAIVPALAMHHGSGPAGVDLYATDLPVRETMAIMPAYCQRAEPYRTFVDALCEAGAGAQLPPVRPMPPFICEAQRQRERSNADPSKALENPIAAIDLH